ncbi:Adenine nucleotide alpha hydrolases-like superfamily protein [Perilla frutescens var. hirtella]|uniref:Cytoplasmic tRNA 2-thiolation protein 2 n=1 Tax=Perilla frutescens var. hirtella TaxID=608512 RepID=A0AAD4J2S9_PERFH|nr:Adenine nucleotide alpha hydrolases-like superfamily protein [Perilla frutescens var. hirtella]KAH6826130.1 Adenine nucleotide alpha hydrolases-like superfamily protein [Perilla frutescens var. hirtella]
MACNSVTCQSGCYRDQNSVHEDGREQRPLDVKGRGLCIKCKINETIAVTHPSVAAAAGDGGRFCADCFRSNMFGKFRFAVTSNAMISPSDNVLVAYSGGSASRVALQFVHEMQQKAQKNFDASRERERVLPVFGVGVAYIDETTMSAEASSEFDKAINEMELIVSNLTPPAKQLFVVPTESIYSPDFAVGRDRLTKLGDAVSDLTGKEDLLKHLRMLCLQKAALENGYTKIILGTCTSRIACHVLEATVKGQGFSLAADIQYVDARWKVPVVLPLRDCLSEELNMLCSLDSLKTVEAFQQPRSGINGLISSFVKLLQEENPSRESTIVRTAGKLTPFSFNNTPEVGDHNDRLASKRRQKKYNLKPNESLPPESFCLICSSPLKKSDTASQNSSDGEEASAETYAAACLSCQYQILPKDTSSMKHFLSLLPQSMTTLAKASSDSHEFLREQIQDFLLSDSDDGT